MKPRIKIIKSEWESTTLSLSKPNWVYPMTVIIEFETIFLKNRRGNTHVGFIVQKHGYYYHSKVFNTESIEDLVKHATPETYTKMLIQEMISDLIETYDTV